MAFRLIYHTKSTPCALLAIQMRGILHGKTMFYYNNVTEVSCDILLN